jgi:hypothetical protein
MMPINLSFRRLLKFGVDLTSQELDEYDSLIAFRQQLLEEFRATNNQKIKDVAEEISIEIDARYQNYSNRFERLRRLYIARRYYGIAQGHLLQIPDSGKKWWTYFKSMNITLWNSISHRVIRVYFSGK